LTTSDILEINSEICPVSGKPCYLEISIHGSTTYAYLDSGATCNAVSEEFCHLHGLKIMPSSSQVQFQFANSETSTSVGTTMIYYLIGKATEQLQAYVLQQLSNNLIFGIPWFQQYSPENWNHPFLTINL
jgi:gag-polyprotein putative aspartyl protease